MHFNQWKQERVSINPMVMGGAPVIAGSRLTIKTVAITAANGYSHELVEDNPELQLTTEDFNYAQEYCKYASPIG